MKIDFSKVKGTFLESQLKKFARELNAAETKETETATTEELQEEIDH